MIYLAQIMLRVTPYVLVVAACIVTGSCTPENEELGDAVAVVDRHIDVREVIHFKRRKPRPEQVAGHEKDERLYFLENDKSKLLESILSGMHVVTDSGKVAVCGPPNAKIDITWTPKVLNEDGVVTVFLDMVAPLDINEAKIVVDVYIENVPDPVFSIDQDVTCADLKKKVKQLNCPIPKGLPIKFQFKELKLQKIPTGTYKLEVKINNERNELFACLKLELTIKEGDM